MTHEARHRLSVVVPVFRNCDVAMSTIESLLRLRAPLGTYVEVVVVDDGSRDGTPSRLAAAFGERIILVCLPLNAGRAAARNAGACRASGDAIIFLDSDCLPASDDFLTAHLAALKSAIASTGDVQSEEQGFWGRYQRRALAARRRAFLGGDRWVGTSANLAVARDAFAQVGGFDEGFRGYGFEDRDLLLRLEAIGEIAWPQGSGVRHGATMSLGEFAAKLHDAAQESAARFRQRHPAAYRKLGYAAIDATLHPWLGALGYAVGFASWLAARLDPYLDKIPFAVAHVITKAIVAVHFIAGTRTPSKRQGQGAKIVR